jgi:hypothetical protein
MIRSIRADHTKFFQVVIKTHSFHLLFLCEHSVVFLILTSGVVGPGCVFHPQLRVEDEDFLQLDVAKNPDESVKVECVQDHSDGGQRWR